MRLTLLSVLTWAVAFSAVVWWPASAQAETIVPRDHHPWGRFEIGSWKKVRVETETLDENNRVISSSTRVTTTTLVDVDDNSYTLHVEVTVEVAGRILRAEPQIFKHGFNGETNGQTAEMKKIRDSFVIIDGEKIPSEIRELVINGGKTKQVCTIYYSSRVAPYILKQEITSTDLEKSALIYRSRVDVIAVGMPYNVKAEIKSTSHVKTIYRRGNSSVITIEIHCTDVPGGVVAHTLKEISNNNQTVVRRSTLELLDYYVGDERDGKTIGGRRRRRIKRGKLPPLKERKKR